MLFDTLTVQALLLGVMPSTTTKAPQQRTRKLKTIRPLRWINPDVFDTDQTIGDLGWWTRGESQFEGDEGPTKEMYSTCIIYIYIFSEVH
ncbi:hypothetical protein PF010_g9761 [Phytophthora fragariae]|uniref:Uncharacterized protein n=1 Tax=Phytophthora fragariae TaxID=53985 RepID=A0A6A3LVN8_9STRA|nr:hypothetical protein PF011_g4051 [Phytophthora fragariae]KAE9114309.1 hypothetical protein PF010_g9761 [Phytophthora fragariae]KAE9234522.1 hypothetical protein PF004_g9353 [Phytophthora fragariae]